MLQCSMFQLHVLNMDKFENMHYFDIVAGNFIYPCLNSFSLNFCQLQKYSPTIKFPLDPSNPSFYFLVCITYIY